MRTSLAHRSSSELYFVRFAEHRERAGTTQETYPFSQDILQAMGEAFPLPGRMDFAYRPPGFCGTLAKHTRKECRHAEGNSQVEASLISSSEVFSYFESARSNVRKSFLPPRQHRISLNHNTWRSTPLSTKREEQALAEGEAFSQFHVPLHIFRIYHQAIDDFGHPE